MLKIRAIETRAFVIRRGDIYDIYGAKDNKFLIYSDNYEWSWIEMSAFEPIVRNV